MLAKRFNGRYHGFNPRTPAGCDQTEKAISTDTTSFQPTHPCGVRRCGIQSSAIIFKFQPTHPCGVRHRLEDVDQGDFGFQPTHPCGVRPNDTESPAPDDPVSTHAPLRGATLVCSGEFRLIASFNPRTPAGCDEGRGILRPTVQEFQPTHPCGVRPLPIMILVSAATVSTHAPLRGATACSSFSGKFIVFQPTHPCGVRRGNADPSLDQLEFQPTHPCGVRPHRSGHRG